MLDTCSFILFFCFTLWMKYFMRKGCEGTLSSQVIASLVQFNGWVHHRDMETWSKVQWFQCFNTCDWLFFNILPLYLTKASNLTSKMETAANNILFTVSSPSVILQIYFIKIVKYSLIIFLQYFKKSRADDMMMFVFNCLMHRNSRIKLSFEQVIYIGWCVLHLLSWHFTFLSSFISSSPPSRLSLISVSSLGMASSLCVWNS